jgi:Bacteriophage head to tail connecting protein
MTSPARPWFRLTTSDPDLDESAAVKSWLAECTRLMQMVFNRSNTYRALHSSYKTIGAFGTTSSLLLPDFKNVIHHYPLPIGEFSLATDYQGRVNTLYREFQMMASQMVAEFGSEKVSDTTRRLAEKNPYAWVTVLQAIEPRTQRDASKRDAKNMQFQSVYLEAGGNDDQILRESGFREFPALCPRWDVTGADIYGESPGMKALGDIKQLQHEQKRKAMGIDYQTMPPLQMPTSAKAALIDTLPGGHSFVDSAVQGGGIRPAFEVNLNLQYLLMDIEDVRGRVRKAFFADLFMMLANSNNPQMTATEVAERHEEKMLMIGPVVERLHNEILEPKIELTFARMLEVGMVPPPPKELQGMELNVEFMSMLAQAQKAVATNSIDRFVGNLGAVAQIKPDVLDKFNADNWVDAYSDAMGIDPDLIVPSNQVALIRKARAQAAQQQAQSEQAAMAVEAASKLGGINTSTPNMLTDVTAPFAGYT